MTSLMYDGGLLISGGVHIDLDPEGDTTTDDQSDSTADRLRCGNARKVRILRRIEDANDSGSEEDDSLLVAYDSNSQVGSV